MKQGFYTLSPEPYESVKSWRSLQFFLSTRSDKRNHLGGKFLVFGGKGSVRAVIPWFPIPLSSDVQGYGFRMHWIPPQPCNSWVVVIDLYEALGNITLIICRYSAGLALDPTDAILLIGIFSIAPTLSVRLGAAVPSRRLRCFGFVVNYHNMSWCSYR